MITHINKGFDYLGWTLEKYKEKLIVEPSKSSTKNLIRKRSTIILRDRKLSTQSDLILRLNQINRSWANYHKHVVSQVRSFHTLITPLIIYYLPQWIKQRHPNKSKWWRLNKYWHKRTEKYGF
ncbi:group II intron maturase-specific domain-containing protein [Paraclostridium bifermentans]|uniref:group II intron maturase-specific domain-containing protein n=1 Tax=Paraclostridium bifermentans TaxID=1490 RepID=UPI003D2AB2C8